MKNTLRDQGGQLTTIDYTKIIDKIREKIDGLNIVYSNQYIDFKGMRQFVKEIADSLKQEHKSIFKILEVEREKKPICLTLNHQDYQAFAHKIKCLANSVPVDFSEIPVISPMEHLKKTSQTDINFGITSRFDSQDLFRKMISFSAEANQEERIRIDEVELKIAVEEISKQLKTNLANYIQQRCDDEDLIEEKIEAVWQEKHGVDRMIMLLNDESLARIKRTVSYLYLEYLLDNANSQQKERKGYKLACNYVQRFKKLETYLKMLVHSPDQEATVHIGTLSYNLCDLLYEGNAFEALPFIGVLNGTLLEDRDEKQKTFKIAMRMKLNGAVQQEGGISSYEYHLKKLLNQEISSKERLRICFLYTFMLLQLQDETFDPIDNWQRIKVRIEEKGFDTVVSEFVDRHSQEKSQIYMAVKEMKEVFTKLIKYKASALAYPHKVYSRNLILYTGILEKDLEASYLFKPCSREKEYLKYVSVIEQHMPSAKTLLNIPIHITMQSKSLYEKGMSEQTSLSYQLEDLKVIPIIMYPDIPRDHERLKKVWDKMQEVYHIRLSSFVEPQEVQGELGWLNTIIYLTTVYLLLDKVLKKVAPVDKKNLYIPIARIHSQKQQEKAPEVASYMRDISKTLEHLLGIDYRAMSQGFVFDKGLNAQYACPNGVASMFNRVPKQFKQTRSFGKQQMAMIVVTSRKTDNGLEGGEEILLLLGEVILFNDDQNGNVICDSWKTFSDYYNGADFYQHPQVLNDIVYELYQKGYTQIIYIAKAPYSSKLNITSQMKSMYFMNENIIHLMRQNKGDLMIYPLYFEQFSAVDYKDATRLNEALYVSNTNELDHYLSNNSQSIAGVLNLYSGKTIGYQSDKEGKYYRSVMIYSTLCNMYEDKQVNVALAEGLICDTKLKSALVEFIIMLHYARYEAHKVLNIKINPYERIIGEDSVATRSVQTFEIDQYNIRFNMLAYLTDVKKIVDKNPEKE